MTTVGPTINASPTPGVAGSGNVLAITSGAQISLNGSVLGGANVIELYYNNNHTAFQKNASLAWYGPITSTSTGGAVSDPTVVSGSPLPTGFLHTVGNQIVSSAGNNVRLACIGYEPYIGNPSTDLPLMRAAGFNCLRPDVTDRNTCPGGVCSFTATDALVSAATAANMKVIFSHHSNEGSFSSGNCGSQQANGIWYDVNSNTVVDGVQWNVLASNQNGCGNAGTVTYAQFKANSVAMAAHYAGNSTVIGWDLWNEPLFGKPLCGAACPTPDVNWGNGNGADIKLMYQSVGSAIEAAAPGVLIIAEGPINCSGTYMSGATMSPALGCMQELTLAGARPLIINNPSGQSVVVYSIHDYPQDVSGQNPDSGPSSVTARNAAFGYLMIGNTAPVWNGEGGSGCAAGAEQNWCAAIVAYSNGNAAGGPTFSASQQGMGWDWWFWGPPGSGIATIPGVCANAGCTTMLTQQKNYWGSMLYTASATGNFRISGGQIFDPTGRPWLSHGINVYTDNAPTVVANAQATPLLTKFPGLNEVRLVFRTSWDTSAALGTVIDRLVALGIVVILDDHVLGNSAPLATGTNLTAENNWFMYWATKYANNPYVWFQGQNEPGNGFNLAAIASREVDFYNWVRNTGNKSIVVQEEPSGGNKLLVGIDATGYDGLGPMTPAAYATMTNIIWDLHFYNFITTPQYSADPVVINAALQGSVPGSLWRYGCTVGNQR